MWHCNRRCKEPEMIAARSASCPSLNSKRFQGALRVRRAGRNTRSSKPRRPRMSMLPSRLLECTRQVLPPPLRPGQVEPFLPPTRAIFQPMWGKTRAERGECLSIFLPRSRPLCRKTKFTTDAAGSLLGARRCDLRRGRLLPGTSRPNLVDGHLGSWLSARRPLP